jgi:hypothetical protein
LKEKRYDWKKIVALPIVLTPIVYK